MARVARARNKPSPYSGGNMKQYKNGALVSTISPTRTYSSTCNDFIGRPVVDSTLTSVQYSGKYPCVSGVIKPVTTIIADTLVLDNFTLQALPLAFTNFTPLTAPAGWYLDLVAGTNPSRPTLNIPELAQDVWDFPRMLKALFGRLGAKSGSGGPKGLAGDYLGVQFGWLPLVEDISKLLDFQHYVLKRNKELHQLYSGEGLRRRLQFEEDNSSTATTMTTSAQNCAITLRLSLDVRKKSWGTIHWYPSTPPSYQPSDHALNQLSKALVLGMNPESLANGIWKVLPWTWLIGWFTNFGKYTLANSWTVPAHHSAACFMSQVETMMTPSGCSVSNALSASVAPSGMAKHTYKNRILSGALTVGFNMPYISMFKLSILTALFVQKFSGRM